MVSKKEKVRMLKYKLVKGSLWLVSLLPWCVLYAVSDLCSVFVRHFYRRRVVRDNLTSAFPEKTDEEIRKIERGFYHQLCDNFVEVVKMLSMSDAEIKRRMTFTGLEEQKRRQEAGKQFCFLYLSHFGNWEWIASVHLSIRQWSGTAQIYHHVYDKVMDRLFCEIRAQYGGLNIEMKETFRRILQMRREGKPYLIGFISDQQPKWNSIHHFVPFLNHDTAVFTGAENIGRKVGAFAMYGRMTRPRRGYYNLELIPLEDEMAGAEENSVTNRYFEMLEQDIKEHPEMWLWTHKRWSRTKEEWQRRQAEKAGM